MSAILNLFSTLLSGLQGKRTYLAAAAGVLTAIATVAGIISPANGTALAAACLSLAQIFQRMATREGTVTLVQLAQDVQQIIEAVKPALPALNEAGATKIGPVDGESS